MFPNDLSATMPWSWSSDAAPRGLGCVLVACRIDDGTAWVIAPPAVSLQPDESDEMRKQWRVAQFQADDAEQLVIAPGEHVTGSYQDVTVEAVRSVVPSDLHNWIKAVYDRQQALADGFGRQNPRVAPNEEHVRAASTRFAELAGTTASRQRANDELEDAIVDVPDTVDEILVRAGGNRHALPRVLRAASAGELKDRLEMARHDVPFLLYREACNCQQVVPLDGQTRLTIGRQMANDIPLPSDSAVSRVHAAIERVGDEWTLVDYGSSRNGSFLNGERVHGRRKLKDGDAILVGVTTIAYVLLSDCQLCSSISAATSSGALSFTPMQRQVLVALCRPLAHGRHGAPSSNQQIAEELCLSVNAVKSHMQTLFEVSGVRSRTMLARLALQRGVISEGEPLVDTARSGRHGRTRAAGAANHPSGHGDA